MKKSIFLSLIFSLGILSSIPKTEAFDMGNSHTQKALSQFSKFIINENSKKDIRAIFLICLTHKLLGKLTDPANHPIKSRHIYGAILLYFLGFHVKNELLNILITAIVVYLDYRITIDENLGANLTGPQGFRHVLSLIYSLCLVSTVSLISDGLKITLIKN